MPAGVPVGTLAIGRVGRRERGAARRRGRGARRRRCARAAPTVPRGADRRTCSHIPTQPSERGVTRVGIIGGGSSAACSRSPATTSGIECTTLDPARRLAGRGRRAGDRRAPTTIASGSPSSPSAPTSSPTSSRTSLSRRPRFVDDDASGLPAARRRSRRRRIGWPRSSSSSGWVAGVALRAGRLARGARRRARRASGPRQC